MYLMNRKLILLLFLVTVSHQIRKIKRIKKSVTALTENSNHDKEIKRRYYNRLRSI